QHLPRAPTLSPPQGRRLLPFCSASELSRSIPGDSGLGACLSQHHRSAITRGDVCAHHRADPCRRKISRTGIWQPISRLPTPHLLALVALHLLRCHRVSEAFARSFVETFNLS